ncbi:hypothetical protein CALVIDRAFT_564502 [Calocera viscosa TUFC12733]|uniref:Uncharacterized protein n=1 Tax=Calocera viscosa (strain TUFC12733) TaxID=1330018 RepID=A0A167LMF5_CALVF|nr:hypothetical protein CALVIDRAFT_564502 [Calocera viscosa TUFC12733]
MSLPSITPARLAIVYTHGDNDNALKAREALSYLNISVHRWLLSGRFPGIGDNRQLFSGLSIGIAKSKQLAVFATMYNMGASIRLPDTANPSGLTSDKVLSQAFRAYAWAVFVEYGGQTAVDEWICRLLDYSMQQFPNADWVVAINNFMALA